MIFCISPKQILTRRLRFRLERSPGESTLIDRTGRCLKMEPLATVAALERYLLKMVCLQSFSRSLAFFMIFGFSVLCTHTFVRIWSERLYFEYIFKRWFSFKFSKQMLQIILRTGSFMMLINKMSVSAWFCSNACTVLVRLFWNGVILLHDQQTCRFVWCLIRLLSSGTTMSDQRLRLWRNCKSRASKASLSHIRETSMKMV